MNALRPAPSSLRCLSHSIPSTSRAVSTPSSYTSENKPLTGYRRRLAKREQQYNEKASYTGPRPLYDPEKYMKYLPQDPQTVADPASTDPHFKEWFRAEGARFKHPAGKGTNWLGGSVPFPANPSFKPPPPLSDALKTMLYSLFLSNPAEWTIRKLSTRFGISLARVEAVLRLKALEESWLKNKPLQTGFLAGMERHLHARKPSPALLSFIPEHQSTYIKDPSFKALEEELNSRQFATSYQREKLRQPKEDQTQEDKKKAEQEAEGMLISDVDMADYEDTVARADGIVGGAGVGGVIGVGAVPEKWKGGLRRIIWEDIREGKDPITAQIYDATRKAYLARKALSRERGDIFPYVVVRPQRPESSDGNQPATWRFVDVGDKFVDKRDQVKREKEKSRRPRRRPCT